MISFPDQRTLVRLVRNALNDVAPGLASSPEQGRNQMSSRTGVIASLLLTALLMLASAALAQTYEGQPEGEQLRAIRHARQAACDMKSVGTTCTYTQEGHKIGGVCQEFKQGLACYNPVGRPGFNNPHSPAVGGMRAGDLPDQ